MCRSHDENKDNQIKEVNEQMMFNLSVQEHDTFWQDGMCLLEGLQMVLMDKWYA
jgi:hypothetical protein